MRNIGLRGADYKAMLRSGIRVRQNIKGITPGEPIRVAVRDLLTGQIGMLQMQ